MSKVFWMPQRSTAIKGHRPANRVNRLKNWKVVSWTTRLRKLAIKLIKAALVQEEDHRKGMTRLLLSLSRASIYHHNMGKILQQLVEISTKRRLMSIMSEPKLILCAVSPEKLSSSFIISPRGTHPQQIIGFQATEVCLWSLSKVKERRPTKSLPKIRDPTEWNPITSTIIILKKMKL